MAQSGSDAAPIGTHPTEEVEVTVERTPEEEEARLRYLEFVQQAAAQALVLAAAAYAYAKQGAGPLRPGVDNVEGTVRAVVGPVYDRFHAVPLDLLKFLDRKENKRKMEALNLRHLSAAVAYAPKTPSPMKHKRRRLFQAAVAATPSPPRRSRRLAHLPEVKYADACAEVLMSKIREVTLKF